MSGPELPRYRCGCGYEGSVFQVAAHKGRRKDARRWPECQGAYIPAGPGVGALSSEPQEEAGLERLSAQEANPPESGATEWPEIVEAAPARSVGKANGSPSQVYLYKETVTVSPVLRTLWNTLCQDEGLELDFPTFLEQSCLRYWKHFHGYEVAVVVRSPQGHLAPVAANGHAPGVG